MKPNQKTSQFNKVHNKLYTEGTIYLCTKGTLKLNDIRL